MLHCVGAVVTAWSTTARAAPCEVRVSQGAPPAWRAAGEAAAGRLATATAANDCGSIDVVVKADGSAVLRFATRDGRVAERALASPDELGPQVDALVVALAPPPAPTTSDTGSPPPAAPPAPAVSAQAAPAPAQVLATAAAGMRVSGAAEKVNTRYLSPAVELGVRGVLAGWDVGVLGEWTPLYWDGSKTDPAGFAMSSILLGLQVGRRMPVWVGALRWGATIAILQLHQEADPTPTDPSPTLDRAQTRVGLHAGAVLPDNAGARFTMDLRADAVITRSGRAQEKLLPPQPGVGVLLTIGVEGRVLLWGCPRLARSAWRRRIRSSSHASGAAMSAPSAFSTTGMARTSGGCSVAWVSHRRTSTTSYRTRSSSWFAARRTTTGAPTRSLG